VSFVAGTGIAHCFVNRGSSDCRLFTVGERKRDVERAFYAEDADYDAFYARERPQCHWADGLALPVRHLTPADYRVMPWRNGGGTTTELAIEPDGAGLEGERFLYRISIADVASDGPFSRFPGYDRHIMLLAGSGMTLECAAHGSIELSAPFEPRAFDGDWDVQGTLTAGPVRDLNVIVDRERASASLAVRVLLAPETLACDRGTTCLIHVIEGALMGAAQGDTLVARRPFPLVPLGAAARVRVAIIRIVPFAADR
jgi:environmental stress-induced protein Ves